MRRNKTTSAPRLISVIERRRQELSAAEWRELQDNEEFWQLADAGYVSCRRAGSERFEIVGHGYVGRARIGEVEVEVREKIDGTLVSLISAATGAEIKIEKVESPTSEFDLLSRHLMAEFIGSAGRYIADRRRPRNRYRATTGPVLAGSLDMPATMRLHASGRPGLFAFHQCEVVRDEPLDRLVLAGLDELDRSAAALGLDSVALHDARWLAGALDEVRDQDFLDTSHSEFLLLGDEIAQDAEIQRADADLARLASVALLHQGFKPDSSSESRVPRAWFLSLEDLFEQSVRNALRELIADHEVDRGEGYPRRMFQGGADTSSANPDIVVHRDGAVTIAGDVKYKHLGSNGGLLGGENVAKKERRPDLYQVLVHAAALETDRAFLVYPSDDEYICRYLGTSATGCRTWAVRVRPTYLVGDLARFLAEIGPL